MKNFAVVIFLFINTYLFAQTEQQSIELPDFVITGRQNIDIPIAAKKKPDFIPTLSKEFFTPQFSPEELPLLISSEPVPVKPGIKTFDDYFNSRLKVQLGRYSFPVGELNLSQTLDNFLFNARVWGSKIIEYIPNSGYNNSGVSLSNEIFLSTKSDFLPGAKIKLAGDYIRDSYKLFASQTPTFLRERNSGSALFSIYSSYSRWVNFGLDFGGSILSLNENGFKETNIVSNGLFEFKMSKIIFGAKTFYTQQTLDKNLSGVNRYNFYSTEGYVKIFAANSFLLTLGIDYAANSPNTFFSPFGSFEWEIDKGLTFSAEYKPHAQFFNSTDFFKRNLYFISGVIDNVFSEYKMNLSGMIKYEYARHFTVAFTGSYSLVNNYFYFEDAINSGKFDIFVLSEAKIFTAGLNMIFYPAQFGYFFGEVLFKDAKDKFDNYIPYQPKIFTSLSYGYDFDFGFGFKARYNSAVDVYTDIVNSNRLKNYHNISLSLYYEILKGLKLAADFQNILNRTNFVWRQYQEKPFDILLGIEYRW